jgi:3-oxoacyl-[acyl-carrier protein] reductase
MTEIDRPHFQDKTVIVTGGSRGIGLATARAFVEAGARVAICARDPERLRQATQQLGGPSRIVGAVADVADPAQMQAFIHEALSALGPIDILVNNAGIAHVGAFAEEPVESFFTVIDANLKGTMLATRLVLPDMLARRQGVVINVASGAGLSGFPELVSYCASKFGVVGFTEALAREVDPLGVRVYAVCPGRVATDMQVLYSGAKVGMPPEKVAQRILRLAGPRPGADTGSCVVVA